MISVVTLSRNLVLRVSERPSAKLNFLPRVVTDDQTRHILLGHQPFLKPFDRRSIKLLHGV